MPRRLWYFVAALGIAVFSFWVIGRAMLGAPGEAPADKLAPPTPEPAERDTLATV